MHNDFYYPQKAYQFGADGYLKKDCDPLELEKAIELIVEGNKYFDESFQEKMYDYLLEHNPTSKQIEIGISERESDVLKLLCNQNTTTEISNELFISDETVKTHRKNLLRKTKSRNLAGLVVFGIKNGYFNP
jgi:DNA-binding NarL/FixJ family response regulator